MLDIPMINVTENLPGRMKRFGCTLHMETDGKIDKFVLENKKLAYRGFTYLKSGYERGSETKLDDLYSNFYYETGLIKVETL